MSMHYLLNAVRDQIRKVLNVSATDCDVMDDMRVPPRAGKFFYAVYPGDYQDQGGGHYLDEMYGVNVAITARVNEPFDRRAATVMQGVAKGLMDRAAALRAPNVIHMNYVLINAASAALQAATPLVVSGFLEPLRYLGGAGQPREVNSSHFHGSKGGEVGLVMDTRFGKCRRIQGIASAT